MRGSRGDPFFMVVIIGASSLHLALEDWASVGGNEELQEDVIHYKGVTFHPKSKSNKIFFIKTLNFKVSLPFSYGKCTSWIGPYQRHKNAYISAMKS